MLHEKFEKMSLYHLHIDNSFNSSDQSSVRLLTHCSRTARGMRLFFSWSRCFPDSVCLFLPNDGLRTTTKATSWRIDSSACRSSSRTSWRTRTSLTGAYAFVWTSPVYLCVDVCVCVCVHVDISCACVCVRVRLRYLSVCVRFLPVSMGLYAQLVLD